ncbi:hypothetical protein [Streptomyces sp. NPDC048638]|uniref:hypothetical protein n=1 Tax=Streptomyces sp. NPDC048638 TaxID=3365580 RepID=UPI0037189062
MGVAPQTVAWCTAREHPYLTYNPWLKRSYCRCGSRQADGEQPLDRAAQHALFHDHLPGAVCGCYLPR